MLINDLVPGVIKKLRGRDDLEADIPTYIKKAILDLTQNYEFEELRVKGPLANFTAGQSEYPVGGSNCPFINSADEKLTFVCSWFVYYSVDSAIGSNTGTEIKYRNLRVVEPGSVIPGRPSYYTRHGNTLIIANQPDDAYPTFMRYQKQHPFTPDAALGSSVIYMPDDWADILEYAAAEKACDNIGMTDLGQLYHAKIFGNPMRRMPGLIMERQSQGQRDSAYNEKQLRPIVRKYQ